MESRYQFSLVLTIVNEQKSILDLIDSIYSQSILPSEIQIIDGGSIDNTLNLILKRYKNDKRIKIKQIKGNIAKGRNKAISQSKYPIIVQIDAGCLAKKDWLEKITLPFKDKKVEFVAGNYKMIAKSPFEIASSFFLGVTPKTYNKDTFLPSGRSMAFRKKVWKKVGGYPEYLKKAGEDTLFNYKIIKAGIPITQAKNAIVYWKVPSNYGILLKKLYDYAFGDAEAFILWHPVQKFRTHILKILFIYFRYSLALTIFMLSSRYPNLSLILILCITLYVLWSIIKMRKLTSDWKVRLWIPIIQIGSDLAIMLGFINGLKRKYGLSKGNY